MGGREEFARQVQGRLALVVTDASVTELAAEFGWMDSWMQTATAKRKAKPPPPSQNVAQALGASAQPAAVPKQAMSLPPVPPKAGGAQPLENGLPTAAPPPKAGGLTGVSAPNVPQTPATLFASPPPVPEAPPQQPSRNLADMLATAASKSKAAPPPRVPSSDASEAETWILGAHPPPPPRQPRPDPIDNGGNREIENPPAAGDAPMCLICHEAMTNPDQNTVLDCGHVYHGACMASFRSAGRITNLSVCPLRCHQGRRRSIFTVNNSAPSSAEQNVVAPEDEYVPDDDDLDGETLEEGEGDEPEEFL